MTGIYVAHTPSQIEQANTLVELLESSLELDESGIRCSTLPGYAGTNSDGESLRADIGGSQAVIALLDDHALRDPQLMLELGVAFTYDKRMLLLVEGVDRGERLPSALRSLSMVERVDGDALISMVEDLAFELGLRPRLGDGAHEAIRMLSSAPPPSDEQPTVRPAKVAASAAPVEVPKAAPLPKLETTPKQRAPAPSSVSAHPASAPPVSARPVSARPVSAPPVQAPLPPPAFEMLEQAAGSVFESLDEPHEPHEPQRDFIAHEPQRDLIAHDGEEIEELGDDDLWTLDDEPVATELGQPGISCLEALDAGRSISECSFHRDEGGDFARELAGTFGRFVDAVGGSWTSLSHLDDVDLWLGATDNLLEALASEQRYAADWYELGYQFSTLRSIAEGGVPDDPEERAAYAEIWHESMEQFWRSADQAGLAAEDVMRIRSMLENLISAEAERDYTHIARSLETLRGHAATADQQRNWFG